MNQSEFIQMLDANPSLKEDLFIRGFLISSKKISDLESFPFYGNWCEHNLGEYYFYAHKLTNIYFYEQSKSQINFLIGHAYNPYTMDFNEDKILENLSKYDDNDSYIDKINELTGIFLLGKIQGNKISFVLDAAGIQSCFYMHQRQDFYITSHAQLLGDILNLSMSPFVKELISYKWYKRILGPYLPADLGPFDNVFRVIPNNLYAFQETVSHKRFWPSSENIDVDNKDYEKIIKAAGDALRNSMNLVVKKWEKPWISLTGGIDSNTSFAAAIDNYDKFETFSYLSAEKETIDVEAAKKISKKFNVKHHIFEIPASNEDVPLFKQRLELFYHNSAYIAELYDNEARKKMYLRDNAKCDCEVKSWVSESIRAYWYKYLNRTKFPKLSGKLYRNLYKIFISNRSLAHKIDNLYEDYIHKYEYDKIPEGYCPADMYYHEIGWGSWGSLNITEMKYCFDITIIYNNRKLLELLFRVPLEKRIADTHHIDIKKYLNKDLYNMGIRIKNMKETKFRANCLNAIFTINQKLP